MSREVNINMFAAAVPFFCFVLVSSKINKLIKTESVML